MVTAGTRLVPGERDEALRSRDRDRALAAGLTPAEVEVADDLAHTGRRAADARAWYPWMKLLRRVQFLLLGGAGVPLLVILVGTIAAPGLLQDGMSFVSGLAVLLAGAWLANLVASWFVPDVLDRLSRATTTYTDGYWSRAARAVKEVEDRLGAGASGTFADALTALHPDAVRLAEGDLLWARLNGTTTSDPELEVLRDRVERQVTAITTRAIRLLGAQAGGREVRPPSSPAALDARPVEWHPTAPPVPDEHPLANPDQLR